MGFRRKKNIISYASGPKMNLDNTGNLWGHFPFRIFSYLPAIEVETISTTGVDRGLKEPCTVCKIYNDGNGTQKIVVPDQSQWARIKQLGDCNKDVNKYRGKKPGGKMVDYASIKIKKNHKPASGKENSSTRI